MNEYCVYKITNLVNNREYIGQTNNPSRRWDEHCWNAEKRPRQLVEVAMQKYGVSSFTYEIIDTVSTREEVNEKEIFYIEKFGTISPSGYNIEAGGKYQPQSQAALLKISQALKGRPSLNKGKPCSDEQKAKTSQTMIGRTYSEDRRKNISEGHKGIVPWNKGKSKFSVEQIKSIQMDNRPYKAIAQEWKISTSTVSVIKSGKGWSQYVK